MFSSRTLSPLRKKQRQHAFQVTVCSKISSHQGSNQKKNKDFSHPPPPQQETSPILCETNVAPENRPPQ